MGNYSTTVRKHKNSDPRYKRGVHKSTIPTVDDLRAAINHNPANFGWEEVCEDDKGRKVWMQFGLELRKVREWRDNEFVTGWFVAKAGEVTGTLFDYGPIPSLNYTLAMRIRAGSDFGTIAPMNRVDAASEYGLGGGW